MAMIFQNNSTKSQQFIALLECINEIIHVALIILQSHITALIAIIDITEIIEWMGHRELICILFH